MTGKAYRMRPWIIAGVLSLIVLIFVVIWQVKTISEKSTPIIRHDNTAESIMVYKKNCARCHGDRGEGFDDKPAIQDTGHTIAEIKNIIRSGRDEMPSFPNIKEPVLTKLSEYVSKL